MRRREEAPVAEAVAADPGAAAAAEDGDDDGGGGDADAHSFPLDTENHCRAPAVSPLCTLHSFPLTNRGY